MNKEKVFGTEASHDLSPAQPTEFNGGESPPAKKPGQKPATDTSSVDVLVSEFLEELNVVSAELATTQKPPAEPRADLTHKHETPGSGRNKRRSSGPRTGLAFDLEEESEDREAIEAELAKTLLELEGRPKSNVIPLTIRDSARPQQQNATVPEIFAAPESLLLTHPEEAPAAPALASARPEIRFIPAPIEDEPQECAAPSGPLADLRTRIKAFPLSRRNVVICIGALALIATLLFAYQYFSLYSTKAGAPPQAPVSQAAAAGPAGSVAKPEGGIAAGKAAQTPDTTNGRQWIEQSSSPLATSTPPRVNSSAAGTAANKAGPGKAAAAKVDANAGPPAAGRGEAPAGATGADAGAVQPPAPGVTGSRGAEAPPTTVVETPPPPTQPAAQPAAQPPSAAKSISEALPAGLTQIPGARRTAPFATAPPPGNLSDLESRADSGKTAKIDPSTLASPAVPLTRVAPQYPATASRIQAKGKVDLTVEVDERGNVTKATAISGPLVLRPAAEEALMKWRFRPATLRGANIKSEVNVSVEFKQ